MSTPCYNFLMVVLTGGTIMIAPLTSGRCQRNGLGISSAVALAILMSVAPHQASAKGGIKSCGFISRGEAARKPSPGGKPKPKTLGVGWGGKRNRDPIPNRC